MAEVENNSFEIDEGQVRNVTGFFESAGWKNLMKVKTFLLSLWMMADVAFDVISCVGYYKKSTAKVKIFIQNLTSFPKINQSFPILSSLVSGD